MRISSTCFIIPYVYVRTYANEFEVMILIFLQKKMCFLGDYAAAAVVRKTSFVMEAENQGGSAPSSLTRTQ